MHKLSLGTSCEGLDLALGRADLSLATLRLPPPLLLSLLLFSLALLLRSSLLLRQLLEPLLC